MQTFARSCKCLLRLTCSDLPLQSHVLTRVKLHVPNVPVCFSVLYNFHRNAGRKIMSAVSIVSHDSISGDEGGQVNRNPSKQKQKKSQ